MQLDFKSYQETQEKRLFVLENQNVALKSNVEEKEVVVAQNSEELETKKRQNKELNENLSDIRAKMNKAQEEHEEEMKKIRRIKEDLEYDKSSLERKTNALKGTLHMSKLIYIVNKQQLFLKNVNKRVIFSQTSRPIAVIFLKCQKTAFLFKNVNG